MTKAQSERSQTGIHQGTRDKVLQIQGLPQLDESDSGIFRSALNYRID